MLIRAAPEVNAPRWFGARSHRRRACLRGLLAPRSFFLAHRSISRDMAAQLVVSESNRLSAIVVPCRATSNRTRCSIVCPRFHLFSRAIQSSATATRGGRHGSGLRARPEANRQVTISPEHAR